MAGVSKEKAGRAYVEEVYGPGRTAELWSASCEKVLPVSVQDFDLGGVLPAVFYMFRWGHRRGKGRFVESYAEAGSQHVTVSSVARVLRQRADIRGFDGEEGQAILGDLLLAFCLENKNKRLGREEQVQRVAPTHYLASWVDLPTRIVHLRYVPELIVALLAGQEGHEILMRTPPDARTWFPVGGGFDRNILLRPFISGMHFTSQSDYAGDRFDETALVSIDELTMVRLAQQIGEAPAKLRGEGGEAIPNQLPIAQRATECFRDDLKRFVRDYADAVPRQLFVELLEACLSAGLFSTLSSVVELLVQWAETGRLPRKQEQEIPGLFVDCSVGANSSLRAASERSFEELMRKAERLPVIFMAIRLLDLETRADAKLRRGLPCFRPYANEWLGFLGDVLWERHESASPVLHQIERDCVALLERLDEQSSEAAVLSNDQVRPNPAWRMAEALTMLQGRKNTNARVVQLVDSAAHVNCPSGLGVRRKTTTSFRGRPAKAVERRSLVLTDTMLDYLVHLHLLSPGNKGSLRQLSFADWRHEIAQRHGLLIDDAPPGLEISQDLLLANRQYAEKRLRDLGLLVGVNDAESMKRLRPRFKPAGEVGGHDA